MAELYFVRHGQASFGTDNYDQLSALGQQQALWLGEYFAERNIQFDRCVIGTQQRHFETAELIAEGQQREFDYELHSGLNEYDFDALFQALGPGQTDFKPALNDKDGYLKQLRPTLRLWLKDELAGPVPETWQAFYNRVAEAFKFATDTSAKRVLVVSSGGPTGTVAGMVMKSPPETAVELNLQVKNSSFSRYFFNKRTIRMASFNESPHLDRVDRQASISFG